MVLALFYTPKQIASSVQNGCFFLDRDGRHFHDILNFLRVLFPRCKMHTVLSCIVVYCIDFLLTVLYLNFTVLCGMLQNLHNI